MTTFKIIANGIEAGTYEGADADAAVEAYARDAGYKSTADAASVLGQSVEGFRAELRVVEVTTSETTMTSTQILANRADSSLNTRSRESAAIHAARVETAGSDSQWNRKLHDLCVLAIEGDEAAREKALTMIGDAS